MTKTLLFAAALTLSVAAQAEASGFKSIYQFTVSSQGSLPLTGVIFDGAGNLYGTTAYGGAGCVDNIGCGTVYRIAPDGTETVLYAFKGYDTDGVSPYADLTLDGDGNLYGTTKFGGGTDCNGEGCGTVFKLAPDGTETVLHAFQDNNHDGIYVDTQLVRDAAGNLYGGALEGGPSGHGVIFKIAPDGTETIVHDFAGPTAGDTANPNSLMADKQGNLYGTTANWDRADCDIYCGAVFKIAPDGTETVLHAFKKSQGYYPQSGLANNGHGRFYGTVEGTLNATVYGGVFEIRP